MDARRPDDETSPPDDATDATDATDPADEIEAIDQADPSDHESAYALLQRGQDLLLQRHFAQAATVLERADRAEPDKASILEALGRAYYNSGQHARSRATFDALIELDPSNPYAHFALGQSLKQLGRPDEARTHLKLAVALSPDSTTYAGALARLGSAPKRKPPTSPSSASEPPSRPPSGPPRRPPTEPG